MQNNTQDLARFGNRELIAATNLLTQYTNGNYEDSKTEFGQNLGVHVEFNPNSGYVFLVDSELRTMMLNESGKLEEWVYCSTCSAEGFKSEMEINDETGECDACREVAKS